jgi:hypothetical protein
VKERVLLPSDVADAIERRAAAAGISFDDMGARVLAEGALAVLRDLLAPLLPGDDFPPPDAATPPGLPGGVTIPNLLQHDQVDPDVTGLDLHDEDGPGGDPA